MTLDVARAIALADVLDTFQRWLHLPDTGALYVVLGDRRREPAGGRPGLAAARRAPGGGKTRC